MDKEFVLKVLATSSGDMLKALVLNKCENIDIDFSRLPLPQGVLSSTFAKVSRQIPPAQPVVPMPDTTRLSAVPTPRPDANTALVVMKDIRFEDIEVKPEPKPIKVELVVAADEEWITYKEAAALRGSSEAAISILVKNNGLEKRKEPGFPIKINRAALMAIRQNKRKAIEAGEV
ncbi:hypothetical protein QWJ07_03900 [Frankia sp. RB7]|nr:hypothetical protein [Frankia sp. RB7]